jgi:acetyl-CoA acetyltransferase/uncharacterized OB-fold protein
VAGVARVPAVEGWFGGEGEESHLTGTRCSDCGTVFFPPQHELCRNPRCRGRQLSEVTLGRRGTVWSCTDARYRPPPPYVAAEPYEPFAIAAVELDDEQLVVLGQVASGHGAEELAAGSRVELVLETLYEEGGVEHLVWRWQPLAAGAQERTSQPPPARPEPAAQPRRRRAARTGHDDVVVIGAGMHPWGKWGKPIAEYGSAAALAALDDAGIEWAEVEYVAAGETVRAGYPGYVAAATIAQALGWNGARVTSCYAACASGAAALDAARSRILAGLCEVALVVGADSTPKGFLAPAAGERPGDPDWLRFRLVGATNPTYFGLYARRRMDLYGSTAADFATVKVKNARHGLHNPNARYRKEVSAAEVLESPMVAYPLRLLDICATSDGAAAVVLASAEFARRHASSSSAAGAGAPPVRVRAISTVTPSFPNTVIEMPNFSTDSSLAVAPQTVSFRDSIALAAYEEAGMSPGDLSLAEVYDLSTALELDWYENIGLCPAGEAEGLLRSGATTLGGRIPVNTSGGLGCFGEAVPAQAIAQICEVVWQLQGRAAGRQVEGAVAGLTANQGLFGHGSAVLLAR